jgi:hypothetical protein
MIGICVTVEMSVWPLRLLYASVRAVRTDPMSVGSRYMSSRILSKTCSTLWEQSWTTGNCVWIQWQAKKLYHKYDRQNSWGIWSTTDENAKRVCAMILMNRMVTIVEVSNQSWSPPWNHLEQTKFSWRLWKMGFQELTRAQLQML